MVVRDSALKRAAEDAEDSIEAWWRGLDATYTQEDFRSIKRIWDDELVPLIEDAISWNQRLFELWEEEDREPMTLRPFFHAPTAKTLDRFLLRFGGASPITINPDAKVNVARETWHEIMHEAERGRGGRAADEFSALDTHVQSWIHEAIEHNPSNPGNPDACTRLKEAVEELC